MKLTQRRGALAARSFSLLALLSLFAAPAFADTGDTAWMQPNGDGDRIRNHPLLRDLDLPPLGGDGRGGPLVTKTLLISALSAGGSDEGLKDLNVQCRSGVAFRMPLDAKAVPVVQS